MWTRGWGEQSSINIQDRDRESLRKKKPPQNPREAQQRRGKEVKVFQQERRITAKTQLDPSVWNRSAYPVRERGARSERGVDGGRLHWCASVRVCATAGWRGREGGAGRRVCQKETEKGEMWGGVQDESFMGLCHAAKSNTNISPATLLSFFVSVQPKF